MIGGYDRYSLKFKKEKKEGENMKKKILSILLILVVGLVLTGCGCEKEKKKMYTIEFDTVGGNTIPSQTVEEGSFVTKPEDPTKEGYVFNGWEYEGERYTFNTTVVRNMTIVATWKTGGSSQSSYYVNFDTDGGNQIYPSSVKTGEAVMRPNDPVKEGYTFKYWSLNGVQYDFSTPVTGAITLKAIWEANGTENISTGKIVVTFDSDNGDEVTTVEVESGKKVTKPTNPKKTGYVFLDWYLEENIYNFSTKVTKDITLKAKWAKEGKYTVQFDTSGATETIASVTVNAGATVKRPTDPTKEGYVLKEWQWNNKTYDFATKVSEDMILKAIWELPKYTVQFDADGGTKVKSQTVEIHKKATKPTNPTKTGYTFVKWVLGEDEYTFTEEVTENITLKAVWEANQYTITFDSDGGSAVESQTVEYNGVVVKPTDPTKAGYTFKEWQLSGKGYNFSTKVTKAITLKAVWTKATAKTYTFEAKKVDPYSPDYTLTIYEDGTKINFNAIKLDGYTLCNGANPTVSEFEIKDVTTLTVVLTSGQEVTATKK